MIFNSDGEFIRKYDIPMATKAECIEIAATKNKYFVNSGAMTQSWCVTDGHHSGRKQDKGIPLD